MVWNKRGEWNIGVGTASVIGGIYLLTRETTGTAILGIILVGIGAWLIFK